MKYDFEIERIKREVEKRNAHRVLIQLPEGLKVYAREIMDQIPCGTILSADPCFGACDIQKMPECDLTIHFAHSKITEDPDVIFVECRADLDCAEVAKKALPMLKGRNIGLVTTVQHIHQLPAVRKVLEENGKKVLIGKRGPKTVYDGQVLGCDFVAATSIKDKVDEFLYIGSGFFHPLGVSYFTGKPVIKADPYLGKVEEMKAEKWEREKYIRQEKAHGAKNIAIVIGTKSGQKNFDQALELKKKLKNAYLITINEITPEKLDYLPFDAFVITACSRLVLDDWKNFKKPILLPEEVV